ncbi:MAG: YifB family Mg chelatase-like AAA ATPase [Bacteroides sp.]|nr:YifB family Mg chelatase-like AAA ATPase [Bacteroides sp.]
MLVKVFSSTYRGIEATLISIEVHITQGIRFFIVGLADHAIRESQQRIEAALSNNGFGWPHFRVVINLAPADIRKEGTHFDLPLAIGILAATAQLNTSRLEHYMALGELSLDGGVSPVKGVLPMVLMARRKGFSGVLVPMGNAAEASVVEGIELVPVSSLMEAVAFFNGGPAPVIKLSRNELFSEKTKIFSSLDFGEVKGQEAVKRAMLIAAAGRHHILLIGSPGSGKSMISRRLPSILPPMALEESLETTVIHSVAGNMGREHGIIQTRPFRTPHHSISNIAMIGGGSSPQPGEISLAHNGVLFLDELPEFRRHVLEVLRQPLEDREIHVSRANYRVVYPSDFVLVAAMNPCPCGYYTHPERECSCGPGIIRHYLSRISGPLLDRIDIHMEVAPVPFDSLSAIESSEESKAMRERVISARLIQSKRFRGINGVEYNSGMGSSLRNKHCLLDHAGKSLLRMATERLGLSVRAYDRILKVARTIADLEGSKKIHAAHVAEAVSYRNLDREGWSG